MSKITHIGPEGLALIKLFEGWSSKPYLCPAKIPTIGWGSTRYADGRKVTMNDPSITKEQGEQLLKATMTKYEMAVDAFCVDTINQQQFDALTSFCYNLGENALKGSTLIKKVNLNPNDPSITKEFLKWVNANGKPLKGLIKRRQAEADLYFKK